MRIESNDHPSKDRKKKDMINENMKKFVEAVEADGELKSKIGALEGADDAIGRAIDIAAESGYTLTEEDFAVLTEEDFQEGGNAALSLDDLDQAAGGISLQEKLFGFTRLRK